MDVEITQIQESGVAKLIDMAAQEGWNPGLHDAATFFKVDPEGFLGVEHAGAMVGGGAIIRHSDRFGFMGLFLIAPEFRGRGIGRKLWYMRRNRLLERLGPNATIGMDGVSAMVDFYREGGFGPRYLSSRFAVKASPNRRNRNENVSEVRAEDRIELDELDHRSFPGQRTSYLSAWLGQPDARHLCHRQSSGRIDGFGTMRPCREGWKIGPLFAETPEAAQEIVRAFMADAVGTNVYIDVPSCNPNGVQLCQDLGMGSVFQCTRMYFGTVPKYEPSLIYGLTSFELG